MRTIERPVLSAITSQGAARARRRLGPLDWLLFLAALLAGGATACSPESSPDEEQTGQLTGAVAVGEIMQRAASVVGYSYWWGHGRWRWDGADHGSCSGSCPSCSHSGGYGADCSGFVAKAWQVPGPSDIATDSHPYSTYNFRYESHHWKQINRSDTKQGDAMVYRSGGGGHIFLYDKANTAFFPFRGWVVSWPV